MSYATLCNDLSTGDLAAIRLLQRYGVVQKTMLCEQGHDMKLYGETGKGKGREGDVVWRWQCNKRECRGPGKKRVNLRTNNWLAGTKLPLCALLRFIWMWSRKYSNKAISEELQMSSKSVVDFKNWLREVCAWRVLCKQEYHKLGGKAALNRMWISKCQCSFMSERQLFVPLPLPKDTIFQKSKPNPTTKTKYPNPKANPKHIRIGVPRHLDAVQRRVAA